jgi:NAD(P)H-dependent FMN reductase
MQLKIVIIYGSTRQARQGIKAARFVQQQLRERGHDVTLVDPLDTPVPLLDRMFKEFPAGTAPEPLGRLAALYRAADAFVIVTGEYNHSVPPPLLNLLDHFLEEYFFRPSAIVSYSGGAFGGVRAAVQLRTTLGELGMPSIPSMFPIPRVGSVFTDDGTTSDAAVIRRFGKFASELEWYAEALHARRQSGVPY